MPSANWSVEVLVQGYPGKSTEQGGLGWSTIALARGHGRVVLLDTGRTGIRKTLLDRLGAAGVSPGAVTDVLITHLHYDHCENWPTFPNAAIHVPGAELDYALGLPEGAPFWPEFCLRALAASPRLRPLREGETGLPGITCFEAPGHSPHHLVFVLAGEPATIFAADVAKNRAELATARAEMSMDAAVHARSIARLLAEWRARPGAVLLAGHDVPMVLRDGLVTPLQPQRNAIEAWLGATPEEVTRFPLA
jgi:glyoxylase-like metal-dependent hydrolase (beta-lactamase superfamily II)